MIIKLCLSCVYFSQEYLDAYQYQDFYGWQRDVPEQIVYNCAKKLGYIRKLRFKCKDHLSTYQTSIKQGGDNMVKIGEIPTEGERLELADLPKELIAHATEERMVEKTEGKSGGLVVKYITDKGKTFAQKYTQVSGATLMRELTRLKVKDTKDLQKNWFKLELTQMRIGKPRMIPIEKLEKVEEDAE